MLAAGDEELPHVGGRREGAVEARAPQEQEGAGPLGEIDHAEDERLGDSGLRRAGEHLGGDGSEADGRQARAVEAQQRRQYRGAHRPQDGAFRHGGEHDELRAGEAQRGEQRQVQRSGNR